MSTDLHVVSPYTREGFAADVAFYLQQKPRQLPSRYFYDGLGSALFDAICRLPWYWVTRAETALLARHARGILASLPRPLNVAELGGGSGDKLALLLERSGERLRRVHLIDISPDALMNARARLAMLPGTPPVTTFRGTYEEGLSRLATHRGHGAWLVLFLGSNIGNFDPPGARQLLRRIRASLVEGDSFLLGTDLIKPPRDLLLAYDDPLQVTAAFNRNLLRRINDELGGTFDLDGFAHRAVWNGAERRVEMHLVSNRRQLVRVAALDLEIVFACDEWIWTESSYKYDPDSVLAEGRDAGFRDGVQWIDKAAGFALTRFLV
jgi:dimethylhistidine N-methyltransferase